MQKVYFHIDLDAFFASVEQLIHPEYRGKPVIVGGIPGDKRSVVSTASYEARKYGVHSAMPLYKAIELCPDGIFVRGSMKLYHDKSSEVMGIFSVYSPTVIQMSVDEAFLDMTGTEKFMGKPIDLAKQLKEQVRKETGLTVSIGIAPSMYLAKIASGLEKPDGLTVIEAGKEEEFMGNLPLNKLWGAGEKTIQRLKASGIVSVKAIQSKSLILLQKLYGESTGSFLYNAVRGNMDMEFGLPAKNHSVSAESTFDEDIYDRYAIETALLNISYTVVYRMFNERIRSRTVVIKIRYEDFTTTSIQHTFDSYVLNSDDMFEKCLFLFNKKYVPGRGIRLLGVGCDSVESIDKPMQQDLFDFGNAKKTKVEEAIFSMQNKDSTLKIKKARQLL